MRRFSFVEKAEYWALIWGTVVMVLTGVAMWFEKALIPYIGKGVLEVDGERTPAGPVPNTSGLRSMYSR